LGAHYKRFLREAREGIAPETTRKLLIRLLTHCQQSVPYYAQIMKERGESYKEDPEEYLRSFPILTKELIRNNFDALKSSDLPKRKWYFNTSGGSTGEPARFIQDWDYAARAGAIKLLFSKFAADKEIGESEIVFWGAERDITGSKNRLAAQFMTALANTTILSVFRLEPEMIRDYIRILNKKKPRLITGYASSMHEMARAAERSNLYVDPQHAIITSAGTLYPFMRETVERVFQCKIYDRYGSREVGDIACERPGHEGYWVAPWGNYLEIVDEHNNRVTDGTRGEILVTSLSNYSMPLIRYQIGDRGVLSPSSKENSQILAEILGRTYDVFINRTGSAIEAGYFMPLLYFRDWIAKYQVVQKSPACILFRIVRSAASFSQTELDDISVGAKKIMHDNYCEVLFEFVDEIPTCNSGKFRFIMSEVQH